MNQVSIPLEELVSLVGRAEARARFPDLEFVDPGAEEMLTHLDVGTREFGESRLRAATVRARAIDGIVRHFFRRNPDGLAIALYPGLCTRFSRVDNGVLRWIDLDLPAVAQLKCRLLRTPERHTVAACCSLSCTGWMSLLGSVRDMPVLFVAEGILLRQTLAQLDAFLTFAAARFSPLTEIVLDHDARRPLRRSSLLSTGACLEIPGDEGGVARYPSLKFFPSASYPPPLELELAEMNQVSRLFRGCDVPSIAHLRFA